MINLFTAFTYSDSILLRHSSFREPAVSRTVTEHHSDRKRLKQVNFHHSFSIYLRSKKTAHSFSYKNFRSSLSMDLLLQLPLEEEIVKINTVKPFLAFFQEFFLGGEVKSIFMLIFLLFSDQILEWERQASGGLTCYETVEFSSQPVNES